MLKNKKGFSLIELIVTIAIMGILVMLATPKFMSYVEKAELARIQHDVKIMEDKMAEDGINGVKDFVDWDDNAKDLGLLVLADLLYETEGRAKNVAKPRTQYGDVASSGDALSEIEVASDYKIMPKIMSKKIKTQLPGTFYTNVDGKVYYEHDKPLTRTNVQNKIECIAPTPEGGNYEFEPSTGTIIKYNGNFQHLVIPASFNVDGICYPVRIIGRGAFMQGNYKQITIPEGVVIIEDEAFYDVELETIIIPSSVTDIRDEIFKDSIVNNIIINSSRNNVTVGDKINSGGYRSPSYNPGGGDSGSTNDDSSDSADTIVTSSGIGYGGGYVGSGKGNVGSSGVARMKGFTSISGGSSNGKVSTSNNKGGKFHYDVIEHNPSGSNGNSSNKGIVIRGNVEFSDGIVVIPPTINVGGEDMPVIVIDKGVYQGKGLVSVVMPEGLERIEDYAFAGNQLIAVNIPSTVVHIGNYAFAFNELTDDKGNFKSTITEIRILSDSTSNRFNNLGKLGDIESNGSKEDKIGSTKLLNHLFLTSISNYKIQVTKDTNKVSGFTEKRINGLIEEGYIPISNANELSNIGTSETNLFGKETKWEGEYVGGLDKKYIQVVDIDLAAIGNFMPIGNGHYNRFNGIYNGGNFKVTNLKVNRQGHNYVGFFGYIDNAVLMNIKLEHIDVAGNIHTGGLVGVSANNSIVKDSYSTGKVTGQENTGGLVGGTISSGSIQGSYSSVDVVGKSNKTGGLVGYNYGAIIENSYSIGEVKGGSFVGGLIGYNWRSPVINSYSSSKIIVTGYIIGGLIGSNMDDVTTNSYYDREASGQSTSKGGFSKSTGEMKKQETYNDWNFDTIWQIDEDINDGYPSLQWQNK